MKLKIVTAAALAAALLAANISVTGFADTGAAENPNRPIVESPSNATKDPKNGSDPVLESPGNGTKESESEDDPTVASPSNATKKSESEDDPTVASPSNATKESEDEGDPTVASPSNATKESEDEGDPTVASPSNATKESESEAVPIVASPTNAIREPKNESSSNAAEVVSAADGEIVFTQKLDAKMEGMFRKLLESSSNKAVMADVAETIVEEHGDEIAQLFDGADIDEIKVFIEVELKRVVIEDGHVQCAQYSVVPKARGFKGGSLVSTENLDCDYQMGDGHRILLAIPEDYIDKDAGDGRGGAYVTRDVARGKLIKGFPYYAYSSWVVPVDDDYGGFGKALIVPSQEEIFEDKYYHDDGDFFWAGVKGLPVGESVSVSFNGYPFHRVEYSSNVARLIDCKIEPDDDSMIITGKQSTEGGLAMFYLFRELDDGLEFKYPFLVEVVDAKVVVTPSYSSGSSSSSSDDGSSYSAPPSKPESSGNWQAGEKGWVYRYEDGTYPSSGWNLLEWQGKTSWYYFGADGYMESGWLTDADGKRYFLHDQVDGTQGYMYTGWHEIDGKWYYFSEAEGGPLGSLVVNATTPDGYQVGEDGAWIQ